MAAEDESFTPTLRSLVDAGEGFAEIVDHETGRVFIAVEKNRFDLQETSNYGAPAHCSVAGDTREAIDAKIDQGYASGVAGEVDARFWDDLRTKLAHRDAVRRGIAPNEGG